VISRHSAFKLDVNGALTQVIGTVSSSGYSGDGGPAKPHAEWHYRNPADSAGNVYVSDTNNSALRLAVQ
jgi:hypothetical protein